MFYRHTTRLLFCLFSFFFQVMNVLMVIMSRRKEFDADKFSAELGYSSELIKALIKLNKDNLSLPINDSLYSLCTHSHPPVPERVMALKKYI